MRMSASRLDTWNRCSLQAKFKYEEKLPTRKTSRMTFGNCVHAALEYYNTSGDVDGAVGMFEDYWENPEKIDAVPDIWPKGTTYHGFYEKGVEMLRTYHEKQGWADRIIIAQEHKFLVPMGRHELMGYVDLIEVKKSARGKAVVRIIDYKTGARQPFKPELALNQQFTMYTYSSLQPEFWLGNGPDFPPIAPNAEEMWEKYKDTPRRAIWFHLMTCKEVDAGDRDEKDYMRLYRMITEIEKAIENDVHVPCISGDSCMLCDFTVPCGVTIPPRDQKVSDDDEHWI